MKRWFLSGYINSIKFINQGNKPDSSHFGTFFDSWDTAHDQLISREELKVIQAKKDMDNAIKSLAKAKKMTKPESKP